MYSKKYGLKTLRNSKDINIQSQEAVQTQDSSQDNTEDIHTKEFSTKLLKTQRKTESSHMKMVRNLLGNVNSN